jgi:ketosteroid isomerase-like protein
MNRNEQLISQFYTSFKDLDAEGMRSCYHANVHFSDPVFPQLKGKEETGAMWAMLINTLKKNPAGWKLDFENVKADATSGSCRWQAHYTFSLTGRAVHNVIEATFQFKDGKIIEHTDTFNFYRWARMAFGFSGAVLGWTPYFKQQVQTTAQKRLEAYLQHYRR